MRSLLYLLLFTFPTLTLANFRCPSTGKIVSEGMNQYDVVSRCGEPTSKVELSGSPVIIQQQGVGVTNKMAIIQPSIPIEEWTYDFGPNQLVKVLRFQNNRLTKIETAGYGLAPRQ